jgi:hypothetical protein
VALHSPAPAERARLLLALGDVAGAAGWVQEPWLRDLDAPTYARERSYLVRPACGSPGTRPTKPSTFWTTSAPGPRPSGGWEV